MSVRTHTLDIYGVHLYLATNKRDWQRLRKDLGFLGKCPSTGGMSTFNEGCLVLWVDVNAQPTTRDLIDTLAHEAAHGARQILDWTEYRGCGEPYAYLVGWLAGWMHEGVTS